MDKQKLLDSVHTYLLTRFPHMQIKPKADSRLMRVIGWVLGKLGMKDFMSSYTTTIGATVYSDDIDWMTLAHEGIHIIDDSRKPIRFKLKYLFPQFLTVFALGAIGAIWCPWAWLCLAFLLCAIPWPSPGRVEAERRGYMMTSLCVYLVYGDYVKSSHYIRSIVQHFIGPDYYFMAWRRAKMEALIKQDIDRAIRLAEGQETDPDFSWIVPIVKG